MHVHTILAAAAAGSGAPDYPYILGLAAIAISLVAFFRVSALRRELLESTPPSAHPPAAAPAGSAAAKGGVPPEIVAVIAAAVATATGGTRRILSIKPMSTSWEKAGRQSVLSSHKIR